jgi:hypothetical protein
MKPGGYHVEVEPEICLAANRASVQYTPRCHQLNKTQMASVRMYIPSHAGMNQVKEVQVSVYWF